MNNEIVFYSMPDGDKKIEVVFQDENFWLTQKTIARLFGVEVPAISKHLGNIYETGELERKAAVSILETVRQEGNRSGFDREIKRIQGKYKHESNGQEAEKDAE